MQSNDRVKWRIWISAISWCVSLAVSFWVGFHVLPGCAGPGEALLALSSAFLPLCFVLAFLAPRLRPLGPIILIGSLAAGVVVFAVTDKKMDHNLLGIEVIGAIVMALPSSALGAFVGALISSRLWRDSHRDKP
jgi:hypothetical protein